MKIKSIMLTSIICLLSYFSAYANNIKAIFVDVNALFETNKMRSAKYVGIIDSAKYMKQTGHTPSQEDLFKKLAPVPAQSTQVTYNDNLNMPLIFSDWLLNTQFNSKLISQIESYLKSSKLSAIEKTVLGNIVKMMLTPESLIDTQQTISATQKVIDELHQNGYKAYLVGNWADTRSLLQGFKKTCQNLTGVICSGDIHLLKPYQEFYQAVLEKTKCDPSQAVWIEKEDKFVDLAKQYGLQVAQFDTKKPKSLASNLKQFGINIK